MDADGHAEGCACGARMAGADDDSGVGLTTPRVSAFAAHAAQPEPATPHRFNAATAHRLPSQSQYDVVIDGVASTGLVDNLAFLEGQSIYLAESGQLAEARAREEMAAGGVVPAADLIEQALGQYRAALVSFEARLARPLLPKDLINHRSLFDTLASDVEVQRANQRLQVALLASNSQAASDNLREVVEELARIEWLTLPARSRSHQGNAVRDLAEQPMERMPSYLTRAHRATMERSKRLLAGLRRARHHYQTPEFSKVTQVADRAFERLEKTFAVMDKVTELKEQGISDPYQALRHAVDLHSELRDDEGGQRHEGRASHASSIDLLESGGSSPGPRPRPSSERRRPAARE